MTVQGSVLAVDLHKTLISKELQLGHGQRARFNNWLKDLEVELQNHLVNRRKTLRWMQLEGGHC